MGPCIFPTTRARAMVRTSVAAGNAGGALKGGIRSSGSGVKEERAVTLLAQALRGRGVSETEVEAAARSRYREILVEVGAKASPGAHAAALRSALRALRRCEASEAPGTSSSSSAPKAPTGTCGATRVSPPMLGDSHKVCFTVPGLLSGTECAELIARCNETGWEAASLEYGLDSGDRAGEAIVNWGLRDSDRCIVHDRRLADAVWQKLKPLVPPDAFAPMKASKVNDCFRCLRYTPGQAGFAKHTDGRTVVDAEISRLTVQIYLSEDFHGGATRLCHVDDSLDATIGVDVVPKTGMALVFDQSICHKGCPVTQGTKFTARSEIMYR